MNTSNFILVWILILFSGITSIQAQSPIRQSGGGEGNDFVLDMAPGLNGSTYILLGYEDSIPLNGEMIHNMGDSPEAILLYKIDASGNYEWHINMGGDGEELVFVDSDTLGNVYVSGSFYGHQFFGDLEFTTDPDESNDNFAFKANANGEIVWFKHLRGPDHEHIQSMVVSDAGELYINGFYDAAFNYSGFTFPAPIGGSDAFVFKLNTNGEAVWNKTFGSAGNDWPWDIIEYGTDQIALVGKFSGDLVGNDFSLTGLGGVDGFLLVVDALNGNTSLSRQFGSGGSEELRGVHTDDQGNFYVNGHFQGSFNWDGMEFSSNGFSDGCVLKLSPNGFLLWGHTYGGSSGDDNAFPPVIFDNTLLFGGSYNRKQNTFGMEVPNNGSRDIFIYGCSLDGTPQFTSHFGGTRADFVAKLRVWDNRLFMGGRFASSELIFPNHTFMNDQSGPTDFYLYEWDYSTMGTLSQSQMGEIRIYPNPATNRIQWDAIATEATLHDLTGRIHVSEAHCRELNISELETGVYILTLIQDNQMKTHRILKQ